MVKCKVCGREFNSLGVHLTRVHKISIDEYLEEYPGSDVNSKESKERRSTGARRKWSNPEYRSNQTERLKSYSNSEENKLRLIAHNKDPEFINSQKSRLSKLATETNKRMWTEDYEACRERATKNALWATTKISITRIQRIVSEYLSEKGIKYSLEKYFTFENRRIRVDIYLDELDLFIEVNGSYWHGKPDSSQEEMTYYQRQGYERDKFKESVLGDRLLILWDTEIYSGEYKTLVDEFITIGHVKQGELLET